MATRRPVDLEAGSKQMVRLLALAFVLVVLLLVVAIPVVTGRT